MNIYRDNYTLSDYNLTISVSDAIGTICGADNIKIDKSELDERIQEGQSMTKEKDKVTAKFVKDGRVLAQVEIDKKPRNPDEKTNKEIKNMTPEERAAYFNNDERREKLKDLLQPVFEMLQNENYQELLKDAEARENMLLPYIESVLQDPTNKRKYKGITAAQVLENLDIMGRIVNPEEVSAEILKRAEKKKKAADARTKQEQKTPGDKITYIPGDTLKTTSTALAKEFFSFAPPITEIEGQLTLNTIYSKGRDINVLSYFSYNEKELQANGIEKREFSDFDYFVAMVCNNLFTEGNRQVSLTKLWHEMGNPKTPNQQQLQELRKSLIKGMSTIINIDNREILEAYNINTDTYEVIKSPVMPVMIKTEHNKANGNIMNETIYIYAKSPFMLVADPLGQITTWKKEILKLYTGSRTARYWKVLRYLMQEIAWMRNDKDRANKIMFKTLFDAVGAKRTEDRNATLKITESLLQEAFIPCKYVSSFNINHARACIEIKPIPKDRPLLPSKTKNQK